MSGHTFAVENGAVVVREPANADGNIVCTLAGHPDHDATTLQAAFICAALDKLQAVYAND